jgi:DNA-binding NarL/FixJ family response regulator
MSSAGQSPAPLDAIIQTFEPSNLRTFEPSNLQTFEPSSAHKMADVVYFVQDMLFTSKIREVAKQTGVTVQSVRDPAALAAAAATAKLVIIDLRLPAAGDALAALAGDPAARAVPSVGFVDHEKTDVMDDARAKGCGQVMAKGQFANALPKLLSGLAA